MDVDETIDDVIYIYDVYVCVFLVFADYIPIPIYSYNYYPIPLSIYPSIYPPPPPLYRKESNERLPSNEAELASMQEDDPRVQNIAKQV